MENSKIEWTDHTFNPWHGCVKVSQGCKNCYADTLDRRFGESHWGPNAPRKMMSEGYWRQPAKWDREAEAVGVRARVFCASMADVFEQLPFDHPSYRAMSRARCRLWEMIGATPHLDWLLLTKRPENIHNLTPCTWEDGFPPNVWVGTSVEDQDTANRRIPELIKVPAAVRFLSVEPLLGPVSLVGTGFEISMSQKLSDPITTNIHWVIVGGESGPHARPMHPDWARALRDQATVAGVAFFFKQWGNWAFDLGWKPDKLAANSEAVVYRDGRVCGPVGDAHLDITMPQELRPNPDAGGVYMINVGKHAAGRLLDGRTWDQFPEVQR